MQLTKLKWHKPKEKMPPALKGGYRTSIRVLVKWSFIYKDGKDKTYSVPQIGFGSHIPGTKIWRIENASSNTGFKIWRWAEVTYPGKRIKEKKKPKIKKTGKKTGPLHNK